MTWCTVNWGRVLERGEIGGEAERGQRGWGCNVSGEGYIEVLGDVKDGGKLLGS